MSGDDADMASEKQHQHSTSKERSKNCTPPAAAMRSSLVR
jgi:hypothetical protein